MFKHAKYLVQSVDWTTPDAVAVMMVSIIMTAAARMIDKIDSWETTQESK